MVRYYPGTDRVHGVLIDFDLASVGRPKTEGHSGKRNGTRLFMSKELLVPNPPAHLERFDWESFFYVICWIASHFSHGDEVSTDAFQTWFDSRDSVLLCIKSVFLCGLSSKELHDQFTDFYKPLISLWIYPLQRMFSDGNRARVKFINEKDERGDETMVFDEETLGGHVSWDRFWGILKQ